MNSARELFPFMLGTLEFKFKLKVTNGQWVRVRLWLQLRLVASCNGVCQCQCNGCPFLVVLRFWRISLKMRLKAEFVNSGLAVNSGLELDRCCLLVQFSIFAIKRCFVDLFSKFALQFAERSLWTIAKISKHRYKYNYGKLTLPHTMLNDAGIGYHPCCVLY